MCVPKTASKPTTRPFAQGWWLAMMAHVGGRQPDGHHRKRFPACRLMRIGLPSTCQCDSVQRAGVPGTGSQRVTVALVKGPA